MIHRRRSCPNEGEQHSVQREQRGQSHHRGGSRADLFETKKGGQEARGK